MDIGELLWTRRKELNMTQKDLSCLSGVSEVKIWQIEKGYNVSIEILDKIAKAVGKKLVVRFEDE